MAKGDIVSVTSRPLTDEEADLVAWFEKQEAESVTNLEAGARQIISLITAFYGLIFGVLAFGKEKFEASLSNPEIIIPGWLSVGLLLLALGAALVVVSPKAYLYREASLDDMRATYHRLLARKSSWFQAAVILFGLGLTAFAALIFSLFGGRI